MYLNTLAILFLLIVYSFSISAQGIEKPPVSEKDQQYIKDWKEVNVPRYNGLHKKGKGMMIGGVILAAAGIGLTVAGAVTYEPISSSLGTYNPQTGGYDGGYVTSNIGSVMLLTFGPMVLLGGGAMMAIGGIKLHKAHAIKKKADNLGVELTCLPLISPVNKTYGACMAITF